MGLGFLTDQELSARFHTAVETAMWSSVLSRLAFTDPMPTGQLRHSFLDAPPMPKPFKGFIDTAQRNAFKIDLDGIRHDAAFTIPSSIVRRNQTGQVDREIASGAKSFARYPWDLFIDAIAANGNAYDGVAFFAATHVLGASGTQKNLLTASEVPNLNVGTATAPTSAEAAKALMGVIGYMRGYLDSAGRPMNVEADSWLVLTPWNLWDPFEQAITQENLASNESNPLPGSLRSKVVHMSEPRMSAAASAVFYVFRLDAADRRPLVIGEESPLDTRVFGIGTEYERLNDNVLVDPRWIGDVELGEPMHASKSTLS